MSPSHIALLLVAGLAAGTVNAIAGGGSLITFPALLAIGLPAKPANFTNSVSVCPGYLASVYGNRAELAGRRSELLRLVPTTALGTLTGSLLLRATPAGAFQVIVPFLVIGAALVLAFQQRLRAVVGQPAQLSRRRRMAGMHTVVGVGAVYGGYFGAALGVMLVAGLGLVLDEALTRINALKNAASAVVGLVTVLVFTLVGRVDWAAVAALAPATLVGGYLGARLARLLPAAALRVTIVAFGLIVGGYLLITALR
ncbi:sulfite exporter TauE/SafE family protein [Rugosimonospora acidiphila]|uniref:Probable membrane transporter protein n=1 Tax=Rugosimonospora acidiphila TaxID=556531 RepID=A0ABP9RRG5_9ACTN